MPYSKKFEHVLQARAHGAQLDDPKLNRIGTDKARSMLDEATREGQKKYLKGAIKR
jgi:hypothetical protein